MSPYVFKSLNWVQSLDYPLSPLGPWVQTEVSGTNPGVGVSGVGWRAVLTEVRRDPWTGRRVCADGTRAVEREFGKGRPGSESET